MRRTPINTVKTNSNVPTFGQKVSSTLKGAGNEISYLGSKVKNWVGAGMPLPKAEGTPYRRGRRINNTKGSALDSAIKGSNVNEMQNNLSANKKKGISNNGVGVGY